MQEEAAAPARCARCCRNRFFGGEEQCCHRRTIQPKIKTDFSFRTLGG